VNAIYSRQTQIIHDKCKIFRANAIYSERLVIAYGGAAICFRSKLQTTVATSSTEAEFIAAVTATKADKYLRSVLFDLGPDYAQTVPTPIYEDNEAAINIQTYNTLSPHRHSILCHTRVETQGR
jgi:hypothetical protein